MNDDWILSAHLNDVSSAAGPMARKCDFADFLIWFFSGNLYVRTTLTWLSEWCWSLSSTPRNSQSWSRWRGTSPDTSLTKGTTTNYFYSSSDKSHRLVLLSYFPKKGGGVGGQHFIKLCHPGAPLINSQVYRGLDFRFVLTNIAPRPANRDEHKFTIFNRR